MPLSSLAKKLLCPLFCCLFVLSVVLVPRESYAIYEGVRDDVKFDSGRRYCRGSDFEFKPFEDNAKVVTWELDNPTCIGFIAGFGTAMLAAGVVVDGVSVPFSGATLIPGMCDPTNDQGLRQKPREKVARKFSPPLAVVVAQTARSMFRYTSLCGARNLEMAYYSSLVSSTAAPCAITPQPACLYNAAQLALATTDVVKCCSATAAYMTLVGTAVAALAVIWDKAHTTYENARLCGHSWNQWQDEDSSNACIKDGIYGKTEGPYKKCLKQLFLKQPAYKCGSSGEQYDCDDIFFEDGPKRDLLQESINNSKEVLRGDKGLKDAFTDGWGIGKDLFNSDGKPNLDVAAIASLNNRFYREYIYGGVEYGDSGEGACYNPWANDKSLRKKYLGYEDDRQKYYMTGSGGSASIFACHRFLSGAINDDTQRAYECCKQRSQNAICIENKTGLGKTLGEYKYKFCQGGSMCSVADTVFEAYFSQTKSNYICAKTYSVCPYNHLLGGGTEIDDTKLNSNPSLGTTSDNYCQYMNHCSKLPILPYVYSSNLTGAYISSACRDLRGDSQNVYGYTAQLVPVNTKNFSAPMAQCFKETMQNLFLNRAGATICEDPKEKPDINGLCSHGYIYKKGDALIGKSIFATIQSKLKSAIQIGLVISIIAFGYAILMGVPKVDSFNKKALLSYIVKIAIVMYFAVGTGWQDHFMEGVINFSGFMTDLTFKLDESKDESKLDGCQFPRFNYADSNEATRYNNPAYPPGLGYLRIWDVLDCKLARALGYGPNVSVPNLIFMILGGFLDYGAGIIFVVASLFMAFVMIMITVRALHIFLMSTTAVILLIYVSPITITCAMFNRTKGIFSGWWKQILGLSLQPMILFAYLGVFITVFDTAIVGDASFSGSGKTAPKAISCDNSSGSDVLFKNAFTKSDNTGEETSIYCIFRVAEIKTFHGFELLGVGLPVLESITPTKLATITKAALLMFIFLQFLDKISEFAEALVGGAQLSSDVAGAAKMAGRVMKGMQAIQKRGMGAAKKMGKFALRKGGEAKNMAKRTVTALGKKSGGGGAGGGGGGDGDVGADRSASSTLAERSGSSAVSDKGANSAQADKSKASKKPGLETIEEGDEGADEDGGSAAAGGGGKARDGGPDGSKDGDSKKDGESKLGSAAASTTASTAQTPLAPATTSNVTPAAAAAAGGGQNPTSPNATQERPSDASDSNAAAATLGDSTPPSTTPPAATSKFAGKASRTPSLDTIEEGDENGDEDTISTREDAVVDENNNDEGGDPDGEEGASGENGEEDNVGGSEGEDGASNNLVAETPAPAAAPQAEQAQTSQAQAQQSAAAAVSVPAAASQPAGQAPKTQQPAALQSPPNNAKSKTAKSSASKPHKIPVADATTLASRNKVVEGGKISSAGQKTHFQPAGGANPNLKQNLAGSKTHYDVESNPEASTANSLAKQVPKATGGKQSKPSSPTWKP